MQNHKTIRRCYAASLEAGTIGVVITYVNGIFFDLNNYLSHTNTFVSDFLLKVRYRLPHPAFHGDVRAPVFAEPKNDGRATSALYCTHLDDVVFDAGTFIVVRYLQGAFLYSYAHEFSAVADAFYFLRLRRVWIRY